VTISEPPRSSPDTDRLDGWKEIAAHLRKGVRTVQRWEKELGLPVRRMGTGRGEVVCASRSELDAWRASLEKTADLGARPDEDSGETPASTAAPASQTGAPASQTAAPDSARQRRGARGWRRTVAAGAGTLLLLTAAGVTWIFLSRSPRQPYDARVEHGRLRVYDDAGRFLWERRFPFPLSQDPEHEASRRTNAPAYVGDVDGDGAREVLFIDNHETASASSGLFLFDSRGGLRFRHTVHRRVRFGDMPATGPWRPHTMAVVAGRTGSAAIWVAFSDRDQFFTVIEKIDPAGNLLGEFWHPGMVEVLRPFRFRGRDVMLFGASSNEFNGGALGVLDQTLPTGTAPAQAHKFTCEGCPTGRPVEYLVFPATELERLQKSTAGVENITVSEGGDVTLTTLHTVDWQRLGRGGVGKGDTLFVLNPSLVPIAAECQPAFRVLHDELHARGLLDHAFGPADDAALWPVLRWNGTGFDRLGPPPPK
jgi:hypothetical protein